MTVAGGPYNNLIFESMSSASLKKPPYGVLLKSGNLPGFGPLLRRILFVEYVPSTLGPFADEMTLGPRGTAVEGLPPLAD